MTEQNSHTVGDLLREIELLKEEKNNLKNQLINLSDQHDQHIRHISHEIAGSLQILMLSLDAIEDNKSNLDNNLGRIRRVLTKLTGIIDQMRKDLKLIK